MTLIDDEQKLIAAKTKFGYDIPVYDDSWGDLYVCRDSMGIVGVVRARTWEDAYEICEDEFFPEATETWEEMEREYSTEFMSGRELWLYEHPMSNWQDFNNLSDEEKNAAYRKSKDVPYVGEITEHACWQEAYGFRPNGSNEHDKLKHGIYAKDLNGDYLDRLTPELVSELEVTLTIENEEAI